MITISPGHYGPRTGAYGIIDEGTENIRVTKRVTAILRAAGITTNYIEDNVNKAQSKNIPWLIAQHNKSSRLIDVSIHFNSSAGTHSKGIGVETLIHNEKNIDVATKLTNAISNVSGLKNRGVKIRTNLGLLKGTNKPCYLIEVCFVNDSVDVALYKRDFEKICQAIASELAKAVGKTITKPSTTSTVEDKGVNDRARKLIRKAVASEVFTSPHNDADKYSQAQLYEYMVTLGERLLK
ncbi:MAG: N-acetylmuramoyl-L-alanine amidase [Solibacillus sp.]